MDHHVEVRFADGGALSVKERRKALGWSRAVLAQRAGVDPRALQLIEHEEWTEEDALRRVDEVLDRTEAGEENVVLPPPPIPSGISDS